MTKPIAKSTSPNSNQELEVIYQSLSRVATRLGLPCRRSQLDWGQAGSDLESETGHEMCIRRLAEPFGIRFAELDHPSVEALVDLVKEGFPVVLLTGEKIEVLDRYESGRFESASFGRENPYMQRHWRSVYKQLRKTKPRVLVGQDELECNALSSANLKKSEGAASHSGDASDSAKHHKSHASPLRRFWAMLRFDRRDVLTVTLFAFVASVLALATPLTVESLINVVSWGVFLQPLLVLSLILLVCLGLAGVMNVLQTVMVETIQRRQLVRVVGDLSHRFPRANRKQFHSVYPRELANRIFDVMTIQKATAVLLFDGISIILNTILGLVLLAVYHPALLGFDIVLVLTMVILTWILGRNGIRTAIEESVTKYRIAHWLQDIIDFPSAFKVSGGERFAIDQANRLTTEYIQARHRQFRVVLRQVVFAVALQVVASTVLLGLGGWLVIQGQLTLGQLVASELVVTVVVGAFAKAGKSLEKYYDLMAGIDKLGYLIDVEIDARADQMELPEESLSLTWSGLHILSGVSANRIADAKIESGKIVALRDNGNGSRSDLARALVGLNDPLGGAVQLADHDVKLWSSMTGERLLAFAGSNEVFHGSVLENVSLGRIGVGRSQVREALQTVGLWETISQTEQGMNLELQTAGKPLNETQVAQLMLARALVSSPRLLVIDGLIDGLGQQVLESVWEAIRQVASDGIVVLTTNRDCIAERCDAMITVGESQ